MPRKIVSQDPIVRPASPEVTYDEMDVTMFRITKTPEGDYRLRARLEAVDSNGDPEGSDYNIMINDLNAQMAVTPKFAAAWDEIVDVMGLAYDFFRLKEKVEQVIAAGEDATALIVARDAALAILREPV